MAGALELYKAIKKVEEERKAKANQTQNDNKNSELLTQLQNMYLAYREKTLKVPDYDKILPVTFVEGKNFDIKSDGELIGEADAYVKEKYKDLDEKIIGAVDKNIDKNEAGMVNKTVSSGEAKTAAREEYYGGRQKALEAMQRQGIYDSSITGQINAQLKGVYDGELGKINTDYANYEFAYNVRRKQLEVSRKEALKEYNITMAAAFEDKMSSLRNERDKAEAEYAAYLAEKEEFSQKDRAERNKLIEQNEQAWLNEQSLIQRQEYENAVKTGAYTGETEKEMQERYRIAYDTYMSMEPTAAKKYINLNEKKLRLLLGAYYDRLAEAVLSKK